jgi:hypothetical protein
MADQRASVCAALQRENATQRDWLRLFGKSE